ncbi:MAG: 30S ribosomal protein S6 [Lachnospiraceae bacterium]|nr:30S ribosomal protein S6 [Lachnospiraceae bacterium]
MNKYEIALVLSSRVDDDVRNTTLEKVKDLVAKANGTVTAVDDQGKKKMAYEIQDMREAYYYFIQVDTDDAAMPATVEAQLRIMDNVIRYLIVRADA